MAFDTYIKVGDIKGECTDDKHKDWIAIQGFAWGMGNEATMESGTSGLNTGKAQMSVFRVSKMTDAASVKLASSAVQGTNFKDMEVHVCTQAGEKNIFLTYKFTDVAVASFQWGGGF